MKNIFTSVLLFLSLSILAQIPQAVNYQAVARTGNGNVIANQKVSMRFTVHDQTSSGTILYQETDTATTNPFGLFTSAIGNGVIVQGTFPGVAWGTGPKYLQVELDPAGGSNFITMGDAQLMSVPYALYAQSSANAGTWQNYAVYTETAVSGNPPSTTLIDSAWTPRYLNHTQTQVGSAIALNANDTSIELAPGTYHITASAPFGLAMLADSITDHFTANSALRIRDFAGNTLLTGQGESITGQELVAAGGGGQVYFLLPWRQQYFARIDGVITIADETSISLQQYMFYYNIWSQGGSFDAGKPISSGENEVYTNVVIQKIN